MVVFFYCVLCFLCVLTPLILTTAPWISRYQFFWYCYDSHAERWGHPVPEKLGHAASEWQSWNLIPGARLSPLCHTTAQCNADVKWIKRDVSVAFLLCIKISACMLDLGSFWLRFWTQICQFEILGTSLSLWASVSSSLKQKYGPSNVLVRMRWDACKAPHKCLLHSLYF